MFVLVFGSGSLAFGFPLRTHTKATSAGMFSEHAATLGPLRAAPVIVIDAPKGKRVPPVKTLRFLPFSLGNIGIWDSPLKKNPQRKANGANPYCHKMVLQVRMSKR